MCSSAPDMSGLADAAKASAQVGQDALDWYKQEYARETPLRDQATALSIQQAQAQAEAAQKQIAAADDSLNYQKSVFRPVEEKLATDAMNYDTPARREAAAAAASADVQANADAQQQATMRDLERVGAAPNSGRVMAMRGMQDIQTAAAKAGAANEARRQVEAQGVARMGDVANLGRNIASGQVAQLQSGTQAGSSAVGSAGAANAVNMSGNSTMQAGFGNAMQGYGQAGNLYAQQASIQEKSNESNSNGMMQAGMMAGMMMSDKNKKKDIEPVDPEKALDEVNATPVSNWAYRAGIDDGSTHTGPMAQDVKRTMGEGVAPEGKMIDPISLVGTTLAAVQGLSKKVDRVAAAVGMGRGAKPARHAHHRVAAAAGV